MIKRLHSLHSGSSLIAEQTDPPYTPYSPVPPKKSDNRDERLARAGLQVERLRSNRERIVETIQRTRRTAKAVLRETRGVSRSKS